jgi:hypothetical protein
LETEDDFCDRGDGTLGEDVPASTVLARGERGEVVGEVSFGREGSKGRRGERGGDDIGETLVLMAVEFNLIELGREFEGEWEIGLVGELELNCKEFESGRIFFSFSFVFLEILMSDLPTSSFISKDTSRVG